MDDRKFLDMCLDALVEAAHYKGECKARDVPCFDFADENYWRARIVDLLDQALERAEQDKAA